VSDMSAEIRDRELYEAYRRFVDDSLEYLHRVTPESTPMPVMSVLVPEFFLEPTGSRVSVHEEERTDWGRIVFSHDEQLRSLESLTTLVKLFDAKRGDIYVFMATQYLFRSLLTQIVVEQQGLSGDSTIIDRAYDQLEFYMQSSHVPCTGGYVTTGVKILPERIDLDMKHSLRQPTDEDLHRYWGKTFHRTNAFFGDLMPSDVLFEVQSDVRNQDLGGFTQYVSDEAEKTLLALRLYKSGRIGLNPLIRFPTIWTPMTGTLSGGRQLEAFSPNDYTLSEADGDTLKLFWEEFQNLWPLIRDFLITAYERLTSSYTHRRAIDRLLDVLIGLESLYSGGPGSISYKLALRCAVFIGLSRDERRTLRAILDAAYDIRSRVAHGGTLADDSAVKIDDEHMPLADFTDNVQRCLARSIMAFARWHFTRGTSGKQLRKEIQDYIDEGLLFTGEIGFA
jgi:hypothetical protein